MFARLLLLPIFVVMFSLAGFSQAPTPKKYPRIEFNDVADHKADTLEFTGKVKSIYKCPPCPEGAQCKPCIGDHVEVTNGNPDSGLRVFTHQLSLFEIDKIYDFLVRFRSSIHRSNNIELVKAKAKN